MADFARPDLCIIGAGLLGIALAQHARRLGAEVVLVDRGRTEGGDDPSQAVALAGLRNIATTVHQSRRGHKIGLGTPEPKIAFKSVQETLDALKSQWAPQGDHAHLAAAGIAVQTGEVRFLDNATLEVGSAKLKPRHIILAMGGTDTIPAIPGLDQVSFFTADTLLQNSRKLTHLLVIGGDADAIALAQVYRRLGSEVTLVPQGQVLPGCDREVVAILMAALVDEGVRVLEGGVVSSVLPRSQGTGAIVAMTNGASEQLDLSHILVCDGRVADLGDIDLEKARLRPARGAIAGLEIRPFGRTSNRLVRVVGLAAGIAQWQQALLHGRSVVESVLLGSTSRPDRSGSRLTLTQPELAQFGSFPLGATGSRGSAMLIRVSMGENPEALARGQREGLVKVLVGRHGELLAASAVGAGAADIVSVLALAREQGTKLDTLANLALPYPSLLAVVTQLAREFVDSRPQSFWVNRLRAIRRLWPF